MSDHQRVTPPADDVRRSLERILASDVFANTGRLSRLLRYVVERSLAGEGDQLKEYVLGVDVFDRGEQYDPRLDSIVRVEARRLRAKLDEYYQDGGADDQIVIQIPRGTYVPVFRRRDPAARVPAPATPSESSVGKRTVAVLAVATAVVLAGVSWVALRTTAAADAKVSVVVLPFEQHAGRADDERLAARLTDAVTSELAQIGSVAVVSRTSARQFEGTRTPLRAIVEALDANFVVEATLEIRADRLHVTARLVDGATDRKIWAANFESPIGDVGALAQRIAVAVDEALRDRR